MKTSRPNSSRARRGRRLSLALVALAMLALSSCDAALLNQVLTNYADNATGNQLNSGDNGWSIDLGSGRRMVLVNDPYTGPLDANGNRPAHVEAIHGFTAVIIDSDGSIDTLTGPNSTPLLVPANPDHKYWVTGGVVDGSSVHLLLQEMPDQQSALVGNTVVSLSLSHLRQATPAIQWVGSRVDIPNDRSAWGEGIVAWDGHWYLYGPPRRPGQPLSTLVAKVPFGSLRTPSSWRYWTGATWSTSQEDADPLREPDGTPVPYLLRPVVYQGRIVSMGTKQAVFTKHFVWATSTSPTDRVTLLEAPDHAPAYVPPEIGQPCGAGKRFVYALHPHSVATDGTSTWSYSTNCDVYTLASRYYRPRFFDIDLDAAPCPALTTDEAEAFIRATHADFLERPPTSTELSNLRTDLTVEGRCRPHYLQAMDDNSAYLGSIVDGLYQQLLGRDPELDGRTYWIGQLRTGAKTVAKVARAIIEDGEFWAKAGATNSGFVTRVYERVLDRSPSPADLSYWVGRLNAGDHPDVVGLAIYQSSESRGIRADALADRFLHRPPTTGERSGWVSTLGSNGGDDIAVSRSIAATETYLDIAQTRF